MKKLIFLSALLLCTVSDFAQSWQWARQNTGGFAAAASGTIYPPKPTCVATDPFGNVYMAGTFTSATMSFGSYSLSNHGDYSMFLVKYDSSGNVQWLRGRYHTSSVMNPKGIVTDALGNIYLTGVLGDIDTAFDTTSCNLAKYDGNGNVIWERKCDSTGSAGEGLAICTDAAGNIYLTGTTNAAGTIGFGSLPPISCDVFTVKYDSAGNPIWLKGTGTTNEDQVSSISSDDSCNIIITGYTTRNTMTFGTTTIPITGAAGYNHLFLAKYDSAGNFLWARSAGGDNDDYAYSVTTDKAGAAYISGTSYSASIAIGTETISHPRGYLAKYDATGNFQWLKANYNFGPCASVKDTNNHIYLAGLMFDFAVINPDTIFSAWSYNCLVIQYDTSGNMLWYRNGGNNDVNIVSALAISPNKDLFTTGYFNGSALNFGAVSVSDPDYSKYDVYLAKLDTLLPVFAKTIVPGDKKIAVSPNPSAGLFTIDLSNFKNSATITVADLSGHVILKRQRENNNSTEFDLSNYPCGAYIINVNAEGNNYYGKIILK